MKEKNERKIELRSPGIQSLISGKTPRIMTVGIPIVCIVLLLLAAVAWFCPITTSDGHTSTFVERVRGN